MVFPAVFAVLGAGAEAAAARSGPGLTFIVLPEVFARMPLGNAFFSFLFFLLLFCGAATSAMSLLEAAVTFAGEKFNLKRVDAVWLMGAIILLLGGYSALSLSGDPKVFAPWQGKAIDFFDFMDEFCNNVMLPLGSMFLCLFAGWAWHDQAVKEMTNDGKLQFAWLGVWAWCVRLIAPVAIAIIGLVGLGVITIG
jgi:NSS family neurotransmitter:Na+ symporter